MEISLLSPDYQTCLESFPQNLHRALRDYLYKYTVHHRIGTDPFFTGLPHGYHKCKSSLITVIFEGVTMQGTMNFNMDFKCNMMLSVQWKHHLSRKKTKVWYRWNQRSDFSVTDCPRTTTSHLQRSDTPRNITSLHHA